MKRLFLFLLPVLPTGWVCDAQGLRDSLTGVPIVVERVVVTGTRVPVPRDVLPTPVSVVTRAEIESGGQTNLMPVLMRRVPGLFVTERGVAGYGVSGGAAGGINMRGMAGGSGRVLMLIDGHPQYATIYGHPVADAYIASDAQRVEVSRGSASILYGASAMGGAINIITRQAGSEQGNRLGVRLAAGSYGLQRYSITDTYRSGRFTAVATANYEGTDGHRPDMRFDEGAGALKLGYELSEAWRATTNVNVAKAAANVPGQITRPLADGRTDVTRGMAGLSVENSYERTRGAINFYYNWGHHVIDDGYYEGGTPQPHMFRSTDYMTGVNIYQAVTPWSGATITAGVDVKLYGGDARRNPETEIYADNVRLSETAGYLLAQQTLGRVMLEAGLRLEHHKLYGTEWVPQAGVSYRPAEGTSLKFSYSKGFRSPNMRELYMNFFPGGPSNPDLLPERSRSFDFTVAQSFMRERAWAELTLFHIAGSNLIAVVPVDGVNKNMNVGKFSNRGIEIAAGWNVRPGITLNANYSYLRMDTPVVGAPRGKLYAGADWSPGRFTLSAGVQSIEGLWLVTGSPEEARTASYTLVDARVSYRATKWLEITARGDNLTGRRYETMAGYPMPGALFTGGVSIDL